MSSPFTFRVAGISYCQEAAMHAFVGDEVRLIAEPNNPYDRNAIRVEIRGSKVGFVPRDMTEALRSFEPGFETSVARVALVVGGGDGYYRGIEVSVERRAEAEPRRVTGPVASGPRYEVLRTMPLQMVLMSLLSRQEGKVAIPMRVDGVLIPMGTAWEREYRPDGNDAWQFDIRCPRSGRPVRFSLFTDEECELLVLK